jgi:hypothetical protein
MSRGKWILDRVAVIAGCEGHGYVLAAAPDGQAMVGEIVTLVRTGLKTIEGVTFRDINDAREAYARMTQATAEAVTDDLRRYCK